MSFRFITKSIHAYLIDYPVAILLMAAPFLLKLGQSGPVALWLSVASGVAALLLGWRFLRSSARPLPVAGA